MPEKIINTECLDIYRIKDGVLLKVYKCKPVSYVYSQFNKRKHEKIADNVYKTKEEISLRAFNAENIIPIGAYIIEDIWVEPVDNYNDFRFEIKTTGNALSGRIDNMNKYLYEISTILTGYSKE